MGDARLLSLHALLFAYEPSPAEAHAHTEMLQLLETAAHPLSRSEYDPGHFTVGAIVVSPDRAALLLVLHRQLGQWLEPGGHIDPGDFDLLTAAAREVGEVADAAWVPLAAVQHTTSDRAVLRAVGKLRSVI